MRNSCTSHAFPSPFAAPPRPSTANSRLGEPLKCDPVLLVKALVLYIITTHVLLWAAVYPARRSHLGHLRKFGCLLEVGMMGQKFCSDWYKPTLKFCVKFIGTWIKPLLLFSRVLSELQIRPMCSPPYLFHFKLSVMFSDFLFFHSQLSPKHLFTCQHKAISYVILIILSYLILSSHSLSFIFIPLRLSLMTHIRKEVYIQDLSTLGHLGYRDCHSLGQEDTLEPPDPELLNVAVLVTVGIFHVVYSSIDPINPT